MNPLFERIQQSADKALKEAYNTMERGLVNANWADLRCVDVMQCKSLTQTKWVVVIEEASPSEQRLQEFVYKYIKEDMANKVNFEIEIITEW